VIAGLLDQAGALASADSPLAVIAYEWRKDRSLVELVLRMWQGRGRQSRQVLAHVHPYGHQIDWLG
ncbi:DUF2332 family protein, partial [Klebsiella pneumoniae]|nr:DUF2332 family protein [Klebsiella pneumoniae]